MSSPSPVLKKPFALLIGIDDYSKSDAMNSLQGAVADVRAVENHLTGKLRVPRHNITTLLDSQATRVNIIQAIQGLAQNPEIKIGDPILIYYAGHGSEATAPEDWGPPGSKVQLIVPYDFQMRTRGVGLEGMMRAIPNRTISALLENLAKKKGDNIVVILDSCHAGAGTERGCDGVRAIPAVGPIPKDLDREIWGVVEGEKARDLARADIVPEFKYYGDASHVLLAACSPNQRAKEVNRRGAFTEALLATLNRYGIEHMSYDRLIKHLPDLPGQTPRCKGLNRDRFWFSTKTVTECPFYEVQTRGTEYILQAGSIHSITSGLEFSLHAIRDRASNPIGSATVVTVGTITSLIEFSTTPPTNVPPNFFAVQTTFSRANALRLYIEDNPRLARLSGKLQAEIESHPHWYTQVDRGNANFEITVKGDTASFAFVNNDIEALGLERLPFRVNLEEEDVIMGVLKAASKFNRHYTNLAPNSGERMDIDEGDRDWDEAGESVSVSLMKLERVRMNSWRPLGPIAMEERLHWKQYVEVVGGNDRYGLEITNNTDQSLYPYLFFFNCNDLSIVPWYMSPTVKGSDQDAPLQPGGVITIGHNGGEGRPWRHIIKPAETTAGGSIIRDAEDMQIDFFKLILTTQPVDFSFMKQETPFNGTSKKPLSEDVELVIRESVLLTVVTRKGSTSG